MTTFIEYKDKNGATVVAEVLFKGFYAVNAPESFKVKHPTNPYITLQIPVNEARVLAS